MSESSQTERAVERADRLAEILVVGVDVEVHRRRESRMSEDGLHELRLHADALVFGVDVELHGEHASPRTRAPPRLLHRSGNRRRSLAPDRRCLLASALLSTRLGAYLRRRRTAADGFGALSGRTNDGRFA